jgi:hypothetical protein
MPELSETAVTDQGEQLENEPLYFVRMCTIVEGEWP